ncbi:MAG: thiaminase II [Dehalococcoidia bacterium]|jgi:thiaminase/transcriptional activator TenA|nr:thiaminase II [Dehalococcoidia bacterium]MDP6226219.1 thiaminase II [Dehalococcoidia bacterium]MDP7082780.1 thiaminase II [Dehalococcoidia bacterium]MDP7200225.1 thiaminase II [Dehalococcoidia bacterium]MDP7511707.1 thiaminase II [Dehalococcoidia bacterium]
MESFTEQLRAEAEPIWSRIFAQPFLWEIKDGTLPLEKFRYYLAQDYLYLEGFARTVALALAKAPDSRTLEELSHRVLTPVERPLHRKLLVQAGLTPEDIYRAGRSPTNVAYVNHMLKTAALHGLGPTAAALLPCPWTYHELKNAVGPSEHPLYSQWTDFYVAGLLQDSVDAWRGFVDAAAREAGAQELDAMREAFLTSSRYEYLFWEMAYRQEQWPV